MDHLSSSGTGTAGDRLAFLVGAPRSGTTWLQLLLSKSERIATANETHLFSGYMHSMFTSWEGMQRSQRTVGLHHLMPEDEFLAVARTFSDTILGKIKAGKPGAEWVLEKTPRHSLHFREILKVYPAARFIHIIRDPRSVTASLRAASQGWGAHWATPSIIAGARRWSREVASARSIRDVTAHYHEIRYEDLKADTPGVLRGVFAFLDIPASEEDCRTYADEAQIGRMSGGGGNWDASREPEGFFRAGKTDGWKTDLTPGAIKAIEITTAPLARELGYIDTPPSGWSPRISLYARIERWERFWEWQKRKILRYL